MAEVSILRHRGAAAPMAREDAIPSAAAGDADWVWIDLTEPDPDAVDAAVHAIGADRAVLGTVRADAYPGARLGTTEVVLVTRSLTASRDRVSTTPVIAVVAAGGLLTIHFEELPGIAYTREQCTTDATFAARGPGTLLSHLIEIGAQRFVPLVEQLEVSIDDLEDRAIEAHPDVLTNAHALRRDASTLRGVLRSQRDAVRTVLRSSTPMLGEATRRRLEDAFDVHQRVVEALDTARVMLTGVIEVYRSAVAERTNEVMKVLTVFSAIVLPLGLLAGIYGMNFQNMPELATRNGYFILLGIMAVVAIGLWLYFVRRGFIGGPKRTSAVGRGLVQLAALPVKTLTSITKVVAGRVIPYDERDREP